MILEFVNLCLLSIDTHSTILFDLRHFSVYFSGQSRCSTSAHGLTVHHHYYQVLTTTTTCTYYTVLGTALGAWRLGRWVGGMLFPPHSVRSRVAATDRVKTSSVTEATTCTCRYTNTYLHRQQRTAVENYNLLSPHVSFLPFLTSPHCAYFAAG